MIKSLLRLWLATFLIVVASAVLLLTDRERPRGGISSLGTDPASHRRIRSVALFQHVSQETMDEGVRGVLAGLAVSGYQEGRTIRVRRYNAEGDTAMSHTIARAIIGDDSELIITLSTPSLQAVAAANRDAKRPHVFGMVSDPVVAGVGISRDDPRKHPPYMVGLGTMQPVAEDFRMARQLAPRLTRIGVAWNASEANSEAGTKIARTVCRELGIELFEANVDGSAAVREAVASLIGRGAEAVWVGGDNTVLSSLDAVIGPARAARVPVFTSVPGCAARGALFDLGADYHRVGQSVGRLAGRVLDGESPADIPILYEVPPEFWINRLALEEQNGGWSFPPQIDAMADVVVEKGGTVRRHPREDLAARAPEARRPSRTWKVGLAAYSESTILDEAVEGFRRGLKEAALVERQDYTTTYHNAQGDIATLNALFDELNGNEADLIVTFSTPALQVALRKVDRKPVVFATVLDPFAAGAGKSDADHRRDVTGVYLAFPYAAMARTILEVAPGARRVGTLFTPGEVNSVLARQRFVEPLKREGLELVSLPVDSPTEVSDAALTLCQSGIDVLCQISDNLSNSSFPAIARACEAAKTPLFTFSTSLVKAGAALGLGSDFAENGREAGMLAAEVIRGNDPSRMPFHATTKTSRSVNLDNARRLGVSVPAEWVKSADEVVPARPATQGRTGHGLSDPPRR
jgi:ABC-type uncharacterized transport system substrate-binding protein